jgi:O-acetyl-ADP-ribose deacetylase (regulator of RNase III)
VESWQIKDVAIPPFGLGAGNLEIDESAGIMLTVIAQHLGAARFPHEITLVAESSEEERALSAALARSGL